MNLELCTMPDDVSSVLRAIVARLDTTLRHLFVVPHIPHASRSIGFLPIRIARMFQPFVIPGNFVFKQTYVAGMGYPSLAFRMTQFCSREKLHSLSPAQLRR